MKNDYRDLVVMSIENYENSLGKQDLYETLVEALITEKTFDADEVF